MKSKLIVLAIAILGFTVTAFSPKTIETVTGVYEGLEDDSYVFTIQTKDGKEKMVFNYLGEDAYETYDLDGDDFVGSNFTITYEASTETEVDDEDNEVEIEILTITKIVLNEK